MIPCQVSSRVLTRGILSDKVFRRHYEGIGVPQDGRRETMANGTLTQQTVSQVHREALAASIDEIARLLQETLSRRLTAYIAGVSDGKTVSRWANREVTEIRDHDTEQRLRTAYEIAKLLLLTESPQTVKAWFIGLSPNLDDTAPAETIRNGQLKETLIASRAFCVGG